MYWIVLFPLAIFACLLQLLVCRHARKVWQRFLGLLPALAALLPAGVLMILFYVVDVDFYFFGTHFLLVMIYAALSGLALAAGSAAGWILWLLLGKRNHIH